MRALPFAAGLATAALPGPAGAALALFAGLHLAGLAAVAALLCALDSWRERPEDAARRQALRAPLPGAGLLRAAGWAAAGCGAALLILSRP